MNGEHQSEEVALRNLPFLRTNDQFPLVMLWSTLHTSQELSRLAYRLISLTQFKALFQAPVPHRD